MAQAAQTVRPALSIGSAGAVLVAILTRAYPSFTPSRT